VSNFLGGQADPGGNPIYEFVVYHRPAEFPSRQLGDPGTA
jgi:hypothetical protein